MTLKRKYLVLAAVSGAVIALDQATKMYIHTQFRLGESLTVIQDFFNITYVRNMGAAFGVLSNSPDTFRTLFFLSMPPIALLIILWILRNVPDEDRLQVFSLSSVFGGAIGNYIDRVRFGYVIDFLDFHFRHLYTWPAFNVADMAIVVGVGFLFLVMVRQHKEERNQKRQMTNANEGA